jgi:hypothetical protein
MQASKKIHVKSKRLNLRLPPPGTDFFSPFFFFKNFGIRLKKEDMSIFQHAEKEKNKKNKGEKKRSILFYEKSK